MSNSQELVFGTKNKAKIDQIQGALAPYDINVLGIDQFIDVPDVKEDKSTLLENAIKKATTYATALGRQVLSMDNGLYLEGLRNEEQPGTQVRRVNGIDRATDEEVLGHYTSLIAAHGGLMKGYFEYALVLARPDGSYASTTLNDRREFTALPCKERQEGYPLESIAVDPNSGKYIAEMTSDEQAHFWQRSIGEPIGEFVCQNIGLQND